MDPDANPGGPNTYGTYGSGYGSATLTQTTKILAEFAVTGLVLKLQNLARQTVIKTVWRNAD